MFLVDLFESNANTKNLLVVYPGRFQPWHRGHRQVFEYLQRKFGRDAVWIATSNKVELPKSPFSFSNKVQFMTHTGVHADRIIETRDPYRVPELVERYDPATTVLIFAVSEKDMADDPRFKMGTKKDGMPTYFQPLLRDLGDCKPLAEHGYIMTVPTFSFSILGQPAHSATEIRQMYSRGNGNQRKEIIKDLFGSYSKEIEQILDSKLLLKVTEDAAGVGVIAKNKKMARDPRYSMSITQDVGYDTMNKNLRAFKLKEEQTDNRILVRIADYAVAHNPALKEKLHELLEKVPTGKYIEDYNAWLIPRDLWVHQLEPKFGQFFQTITTTGSTYNEDVTDFNQQDPMNPRVAPDGGVGTMPLRDWKKILQKRIAELNKEISLAMDPALVDKQHIWNNIAKLLDPAGSIANIARAVVDAHTELESQRRAGGTKSRGISKD